MIGEMVAIIVFIALVVAAVAFFKGPAMIEAIAWTLREWKDAINSIKEEKE